MANVINRITKQYLKSVNTPDYPVSEWIHNPVLPDCTPKFWVIESNIVREMTISEKIELAYSTESSVYLIVEKQLKLNINGHDYEGNINVIINPTMPACEIKYTKVVSGVVVEMTTEEKAIIDLPEIERIESKTAIQTAYETAMTQLQTIQNTTSPTNAQVINAIKQIAAIQEKLLKFIYRNLIT